MSPLLFFVLVAPFALLADDDMPHGEEFFEDCSMCHSDDAWSPAEVSDEFAHAESSGFALEGVHATLECRSCHVSLVFEEANSACASCHKDPHLGELGLSCERCHSPRSFIERGRFVRLHNETRFPLVGAHLAAECQSCHTPEPQGALQWVGLPSECAACHLSQYESTDDPDHGSLGFPTDCRECHRPISWEGARFDHGFTGFPLTGAHRGADCSECHVDGVYEGTPTDCYACHQADYESTDDPDHQLAGFPTDCRECHSTSSWDDADFDHNFPIFSGTHRGRWDSCTDCHTQPGNFSSFNCLNCHPHSDEDKTRDDHSQVGGFSYDSDSCYACHPRGSE